MKDREDKSRGIVTHITETLDKIKPTESSTHKVIVHTPRLCVHINGQEEYRIRLIHVQLERTGGGNGIFSFLPHFSKHRQTEASRCVRVPLVCLGCTSITVMSHCDIPMMILESACVEETDCLLRVPRSRNPLS